jgi:hypothetical protein
MQPDVRDRVGRLLASLATRETVVEELGTPDLEEGPELEELVGMGSAALPALLFALGEQDSRRLAYTLRALGRIGDPAAIDAIEDARARLQAIADKGGWDYAALGQANLALEAVRRR